MPLTIDETRYIFPPRAESAIPREDNQIFKDLGWTAQFKYNDTRCLIKLCSDGRIELWNRHAERIRGYHAPITLQEQLEALQTREDLGIKGYSLFDGGLLDQKHTAIKNTIVIWDILVRDGEYLLGTDYNSRYNIVHALCIGEPYKYEGTTLGNKITDDIFVPNNHNPNEWAEAWETVDKLNEPFLAKGQGPLLEGLVYKNPDGLLETGFREKNNSSWMTRSRVTTGRHTF